MENFPEYALRRGVPVRELISGYRGGYQAHFVLERNGRPALTIFLSPSNRTKRPGICDTVQAHGLRVLCFHTRLSNRRDYVIDRVRTALES